MANRHRPRRPHVPRSAGRLGGDRGQAGGRDRGGRTAHPVPGATPAGPRLRRLPRCAGGTDDQASGARNPLCGARPGRPARRARAGTAIVCRMTPESAVLTERRERILLITINRPDQRNAVNAAVAAGIAQALDELDGASDLSVGVLTGAGRGFCSGKDLKAFVSGERPHIAGRGFAGIVERPPDKPLIAAVEGFAVAGGLEIALACDLIVAARGARLGIPEVKRSLVAAGGALLRLPRTLPRNVAMELALTGELITAERAHTLGLVNRLTEPGEALTEAVALAETIAANGPLALAATKRVLSASSDWPDSAFFERQSEIVAPVMSSEDAREGARAFAEKRPPVWRGR